MIESQSMNCLCLYAMESPIDRRTKKFHILEDIYHSVEILIDETSNTSGFGKESYFQSPRKIDLKKK